MRWLLLALLLASCDRTAPKPILHQRGDCERAGERIEKLQCRNPSGKPLWVTPRGATFAEACVTAAKDGRDWNANCIARMKSCDELLQRTRGELCE